MIALLPMYDWDEVREATDRFWDRIRDALDARGIAAPRTLTRGMDMWQAWQSPDLVLGQTCGFPFRTRLHGHVALVGTPDFALPDAAPGSYYSQLVVRAQECRTLAEVFARRLAANSRDSQSGWAAPLNHAAAQGWTVGETVLTGAHLESARAVAEGRADVAAIDAVTWRLVEAYRPALAGQLRVIARTAPATPGLPYITAKGHDAAAIAAAVDDAVPALSAADRALLGIAGHVRIPEADYLAVPVPQDH